MENARKFLPLIVGGIVAALVFFLSRKGGQGGWDTQERYQILEKAREAKLAKSILKKSEHEESTTDSGD
jgi:hypothetical protein